MAQMEAPESDVHEDQVSDSKVKSVIRDDRVNDRYKHILKIDKVTG